MADGVNVDFSLLGKPQDYVGDYVNSFKIGQELGKQGAVQSANALFAKNPQAGVNAMTAIDPVQGAALQTINQGNQDRTTSKAEASAEASGDWEGAKAAAAAGGKTGDVMDLSQHIQDMSDQDKQDTADHAEKLAAVQNAIMNAVPMPPMADPATQAQVIAQRKDMATHVVQASGYAPDQVAAVQGMDFSDAGMHASIMSTLALKDQIAQSQKQAELTETSRHHLVMENAPKFSTVGADQTLVQTAGGASPQAPGGSPAGAAGAPTATLGGPVGQQVQAAAQGMNATPAENTYLGNLAMRESAGNPNARSGSSTGLFQFHPDTFAAAGGGNINDVGDQTKAALTLARQNAPALQGVLGRAPTPGELYLAHQQGIGGAKALLAGGDGMTAVQALTPVYAAKFGSRAAAIAQQAVVGNGGSPTMTAGQFAQHVQGYFGGGSGGGAGSGGSASSGPSSAATPGGPGTVIFRGANVAGAALGDSTKTGEDYLATLPQAEAAQIRAMASGRSAVPPANSRAPNAARQRLELSQYDPSYDEGRYKARAGVEADFASARPGSSGGALASAGKVINHLTAMDGNIAQMQNMGWRTGNSFGNWVKAEAGNPAIEPLLADRTAISLELTKFFAGSRGGSVEEIKNWMDRLDAAKSPAALHTTIGEITNLMGGQIGPIASQFNTAMGTQRPDEDFLEPKAAAQYQRIRGDSQADIAKQAFVHQYLQRPDVANGRLGDPQAAAAKAWAAEQAGHHFSSAPIRGNAFTPQGAPPAARNAPRVAPTGAGHLTDAQVRAMAGI